VKNEDCLIAFGNHLKHLRKKHKISQQQLAFDADIDKKTIQRIETNQLNPSLDTLCSIALGLKISLSELLEFKYSTREL
jgi:transcriptional regulator with XRE-family HTH domain